MKGCLIESDDGERTAACHNLDKDPPRLGKAPSNNVHPFSCPKFYSKIMVAPKTTRVKGITAPRLIDIPLEEPLNIVEALVMATYCSISHSFSPLDRLQGETYRYTQTRIPLICPPFCPASDITSLSAFHRNSFDRIPIISHLFIFGLVPLYQPACPVDRPLGTGRYTCWPDRKLDSGGCCGVFVLAGFGVEGLRFLESTDYPTIDEPL